MLLQLMLQYVGEAVSWKPSENKQYQTKVFTFHIYISPTRVGGMKKVIQLTYKGIADKFVCSPRVRD
jgi:hypothetical protein